MSCAALVLLTEDATLMMPPSPLTYLAAQHALTAVVWHRL
jgi:hypothetical protein